MFLDASSNRRYTRDRAVWEAELQRALAPAPARPSGPQQTWGNLIDEFIESNYGATNLGWVESTVRQRHGHLNNHIRPAIGDDRLYQAGRETVTKLVTYLRGTGLSGQTAASVMNAFSVLTTYMLDTGLADSLPWDDRWFRRQATNIRAVITATNDRDDADDVRFDPTSTPLPSSEQVERLCELFTDQWLARAGVSEREARRFGLMPMVQYGTGCRASELLVLRIDRYHADRGVIYITGQLDRQSRWDVADGPTVNPPKHTNRLAADHWRRNRPVRLLQASQSAFDDLMTDAPHPWFWVPPRSLQAGHTNEYVTDWLTLYMRTFANAAALFEGEYGFGLTPHTLRHAHAMHCITTRALDIVSLSRNLGHATPDVTSRVYLQRSLDEIPQGWFRWVRFLHPEHLTQVEVMPT